MKKLFIAAIFSFIVFMSCDETAKQTEPVAPTEPVVYVGGIFSGPETKACYWANGERHELDGTSVRSITAVKGKVYAVGYYRENDTVKACYWADNVRHDLPDLVNGAELAVCKISVNGGDVYIVGTTDEGIRYWINGVMQPLLSDGVVRDVYAADGKVYMAGYYVSGPVIKACFWANGNRYDMLGSVDYFANSITAYEDEIVIFGASRWYLDKTGKDFNRCYWTYGYGQQYKSEEAFIAVYKGDVYTSTYTDKRVINKNGVYHCEDRAFYFSEIAVFRGKVYMSVTNGYYIDDVFYEINHSDGYCFSYCICVE
jgi:hypothetical protein